MILRGYQQEACQRVREEWKEHQSTLLVLPTGLGKTVVFSHLIHQMFPRRCLVIAHRTELITQAVEKIRAITGFKTAIEMGDQRIMLGDMHGDPHVVVSSIQTQSAGGDGSGRMTKFDPSYFGLMIVDEGHHGTGASYQKTIAYYKQNPRLKILGVTATPDRADEEALGQIYETVAMDLEILDAVNDGWLVPVQQQMVTVGTLDFSQIRTTAGDLNGADLARVMEAETILQGVCSATMQIIGNRRTLIFTASVSQAECISEILNRHRDGCSDWACGKTPKDIRAAKLAKFKSGEKQIMVNCGLFTEGFDDPGVEVIVMAKPTKSRSLYAQMVGRSLRPAENIAHKLNDVETSEERKAMIASSVKKEALIIDFVGNAGRHKLMTTADILGGNVTDDVLEAAVRVAKERGTPVDMTDIIEEEQRKADAEAARRARLVARAKFAMQNVDPFDVFQLKREKDRGWNAGKVLTEKQDALLRKQGFDPDALGYTGSKQIIGELTRRWHDNLCSFKMAKILRKHGLDGNVSFEVAKQQIDEIAEREGWAR